MSLATGICEEVKLNKTSKRMEYSGQVRPGLGMLCLQQHEACTRRPQDQLLASKLCRRAAQDEGSIVSLQHRALVLRSPIHGCPHAH